MNALNVIEAPSLPLLAFVTANAPAEEIEQWKALTGQEWDPDGMAAAILLTPGPKWAITTEDGDPLTAGGYTQQSPGVWRSWMIARDECWSENHAEGVTQIVNGLLGLMFTDLKAHRLETLCLADRPRARRWYEKHLGLQCEGICRAAGVNREDVALYAKVR